jgi:hypothetical protein
MYINDIAEKLIYLSRLFADDTSFSYSNRDEVQIKTVIDHDLKELDKWSKKWLMSFNPDKTEICYFQIRIIQNSILLLMEELVLLQILTDIWELHLAAMLNGIYIFKIYC